jgi:hypothetical protein
MKKLEIEKTKSTFIISTFKTNIIKVGLVFSTSNFFITKTSLANNWRSFSSSYLALAIAEFFWKMQRKTWYSILRVDAMPLFLKNLLLKNILTKKI